MEDQNRTQHMNLSISPLTVGMRVYFSSYHLWAAEHLVSLASKIEDAHSGPSRFDIEHRAYVTNALISSVAFVEAAINEILRDAASNHLAYIKPLSAETRVSMAEFWDNGERQSTLCKYQKVLSTAKKEQFHKGRQPYQDAKLVIRLRNELVHYKPETLYAAETHKFEKSLRRKFPQNRMMTTAGNPFFPDKCLGSGCAMWAVTSSKKFVDEFFQRINVIPNYQRGPISKTPP